MKKDKQSGCIIFLTVLIFASWTTAQPQWEIKKRKVYTLHYTTTDHDFIKEYQKLIEQAIQNNQTFFGSPFKQRFEVFIHPDRASLDHQWQTDWKMPDFKSECWMVASGIATKLDILSPRTWETQSCDHHYADHLQTQNLITHELVHAFHGQHNTSPDFSEVSGIDWLVEGLATYASGQCDSIRIGEVKKALLENKVPLSLDQFWTGKIKYGLSGSMVLYIDHQYGRTRLTSLLAYATKEDVLKALKIDEAQLLQDWRLYLGQYTL